jgi:hypothetical protein
MRGDGQDARGTGEKLTTETRRHGGRAADYADGRRFDLIFMRRAHVGWASREWYHWRRGRSPRVKPQRGETRGSVPRRLLLISCSERKRLEVGALPAIERYDGPAFQVLRRYLRTDGDRELGVYVLSAKYGLISSNTPIRTYDRKMTTARAQELRPTVGARLKTILRVRRYQEMFICAGQVYLDALGDLNCLKVPVQLGALGQGKKIASLRRWLTRDVA